jgi:hypothetical protein
METENAESAENWTGLAAANQLPLYIIDKESLNTMGRESPSKLQRTAIACSIWDCRENGIYYISGFEGTSSRIRVAFLEPEGSMTVKMFPRGAVQIIACHSKALGIIQLRVSLVDAANPFVLVDSNYNMTTWLEDSVKEFDWHIASNISGIDGALGQNLTCKLLDRLHQLIGPSDMRRVSTGGMIDCEFLSLTWRHALLINLWQCKVLF